MLLFEAAVSISSFPVDHLYIPIQFYAGKLDEEKNNNNYDVHGMEQNTNASASDRNHVIRFGWCSSCSRASRLELIFYLV